MSKQDKPSVAVIGTGMIASSLAVLFTGHGVETTLFARSERSEKRCRKQYDDFFEALKEHDLVDDAQIGICGKYLHFTDAYQDLAAADYVFESAKEDLAVKHAIYGELEKVLENPEALISTTSALSADDLAEGLAKYADRLIVAHPFFPPHLVPFVEVVRSAKTAAGVAEEAAGFLEAMDRQVVILKKSAPGFVANRLQHALFREAINIVEQGIADPRDVDKAAMYSFMPRYTSIGLFEHFDNSGVDLNYNIENYLFKDLSAADAAPQMVCDLVEKGDLGVKTGKGVYDWSEVDMDDFQARIGAPYWKYVDWKMPKE
ncbi:MAG: 3-hydroxyacyl-CoA dehydrogenase family protein [Eubacteriales bacterium]|jgi:3-hydroxybutyryl-CoA dehydrogenase|nr:3-hydroxyacyl-CoA dehydrogenase family protein [Eubacteriales bacterium]